MQGSARLRQTTCTQGAPTPSKSKPQLKAPKTGLRNEQELLSGIPEGLASLTGLANPGFAFTPEEPKVVVSMDSSVEKKCVFLAAV